MIYKNIVKGTFISRPNRFIAIVDIHGTEETVHVKNTGRCREILIPGATVYLQRSENPNRKTTYDLITVVKNQKQLINIDSQIPNAAVEEWLKQSGMFSEGAVIRREVNYGNSRFDLYITDGNRKCFMEVKGVTLENDGVASFPDAPTLRGSKHLSELIECIKTGYEAYIVFVIQMKGVAMFTPNQTTDPIFANTLKLASDAGVKILAYDCNVTKNSIEIDQAIPIEL